MTTDWQRSGAAPKNGKVFWAFNCDRQSIFKAVWETGEECAIRRERGIPEQYESAFVEAANRDEYVVFHWWKPLKDIPEPPHDS